MRVTMLVVRAVTSMDSFARAVPSAVNRSTNDWGATRFVITITGIPPPMPGGPDIEPGGSPDPHPMMSSVMSMQPNRAMGGKGLLLFKFCQDFIKEKL
jgi:hypothetical protein